MFPATAITIITSNIDGDRVSSCSMVYRTPEQCEAARQRAVTALVEPPRKAGGGPRMKHPKPVERVLDSGE